MAQWRGRDDYGMGQYAGDKDTYDLRYGHLKLPGLRPRVTGDRDRNRVYRDYPAIIRAAGLNGPGAQNPETPDYKALYHTALSELKELRPKANKYDRITEIVTK